MADIQRLLRSALLTGDKTRGQRHHHQHNRHVDQKHRSPVKMLQQHTANQRAKRCPAGTDRRPDAERDVAIFRVGKERADPRQSGRNDHGRTNRQRGARRDQPPC